jgi:hypothetical protein
MLTDWPTRPRHRLARDDWSRPRRRSSPARNRRWWPGSTGCSPTPWQLAGLTALILGIYVIVVLGLGRTPDGSERTLLLLSMVAAALAALLYLPARRWLTERANRLVYGVRVAPDETLRTFGQRLTRSIPLDELMLQLAENLRSSMSVGLGRGLDGPGRTLRDRWPGCPHRQPPPDHDRADGTPGRRPSGREWRDLARHLAAAARRAGGQFGDARRPGRPLPACCWASSS